METRDQKALKFIERHKECFDERLVDIVKRQDERVSSFKVLVVKKDITISRLSNKVKNLTLKLKIANDKIYTLKDIDDENKELNEIIKDLNDELEKLRNIKDEYQKELDILKKEKDQAHKINEELKRKIRKLESANSSNSNMPSSFDVLSHTKKVTNSRIKTNRKRGGQKAHELHRSRLYDKVDEIVDVKVRKIPNGAIPVFDERRGLLYHKV